MTESVCGVLEQQELSIMAHCTATKPCDLPTMFTDFALEFCYSRVKSSSPWKSPFSIYSSGFERRFCKTRDCKKKWKRKSKQLPNGLKKMFYLALAGYSFLLEPIMIHFGKSGVFKHKKISAAVICMSYYIFLILKNLIKRLNTSNVLVCFSVLTLSVALGPRLAGSYYIHKK